MSATERCECGHAKPEHFGMSPHWCTECACGVFRPRAASPVPVGTPKDRFVVSDPPRCDKCGGSKPLPGWTAAMLADPRACHCPKPVPVGTTAQACAKCHHGVHMHEDGRCAVWECWCTAFYPAAPVGTSAPTCEDCGRIAAYDTGGYWCANMSCENIADIVPPCDLCAGDEMRPCPRCRPTHTDLMVPPESIPDYVPPAAPTSEPRIVQIACAANDVNGHALYALCSDGVVRVYLDLNGDWRALPHITTKEVPHD